MKIRFTPGRPRPADDNDVEELYLDIDTGDGLGFKHYVVHEHHHGEGPVLAEHAALPWIQKRAGRNGSAAALVPSAGPDPSAGMPRIWVVASDIDAIGHVARGSPAGPAFRRLRGLNGR